MWSVVYRGPLGQFEVRGGFPDADAAVLALVYDRTLQGSPLVVEAWKAEPLLAILNAKAPA